MKKPFIITGRKGVLDALQNGVCFQEILITQSTLNSLRAVLAQQKLKVVLKEELDSRVSTNHQGIAGILTQLNIHNDLKLIQKLQPPTILLLDHIESPYNLGAIIRSANAFGVNYIIVPNRRAAFINEYVLKVSSGGFVNMHFFQVNSLIAAVNKLKKLDYWIYATHKDQSSQDLKTTSLRQKCVIIVGNEDKGVSKALLRASDTKIWIQTIGSVESLNVSVATAIILSSVR